MCSFLQHETIHRPPSTLTPFNANFLRRQTERTAVQKQDLFQCQTVVLHKEQNGVMSDEFRDSYSLHSHVFYILRYYGLESSTRTGRAETRHTSRALDELISSNCVEV